MVRGLLVAAAIAVGIATPSAGAAAWSADLRTARAGLAAAAEQGRVEPAQAAAYETVLDAVAATLPRLPATRRRTLAAALDLVAAHADAYEPARARILFTALEENRTYLAERPVPRAGLDVVARDGTVLRAVAGLGLQFHPLANAARLNAYAAAGRADEAARLGRALLERAAPLEGGAAAWEYAYPFANVRAPWTSGMAQAVLAQALARASALTADGTFLATARAAYLAVPGALALELPEGPWVRLYQGLDLVVLNAQLQSAVSLAEYASISGDAEAAEYAARLRASSAALLPRFDTGYWSRYSLGGESSLSYHRYVISLLRRLGRETHEPVWTETADRFAAYELQPPLVKAGTPPPVYPTARGDSHSTASIRVWVSKLSDVSLFVDGKWRRTRRLRGGWNVLRWQTPPALRVGELPARISVRGPVGHRAEVELAPLDVRADTTPPTLVADAGRRRIYWRAADEASERIRIRLRLARGGVRRTLDLGRRPLNGLWTLRLPKGAWWGVLEAVDASGNVARRALGRVA